MTEVLRVVNESGKPIGEAAPPAVETGALLKMVEDGDDQPQCREDRVRRDVQRGQGRRGDDQRARPGSGFR